MPSASYDDAFRILQAATAAEQNGMYEEAMERYSTSAAMLMTLAGAESDAVKKDRATSRATQVQKRADALRNWLESIDQGEDVDEMPIVGDHGEPSLHDVSHICEDCDGTAPYPNAETKERTEFTHMTYTPVCSKMHGDFVADGYDLLCNRIRPGQVRIYCTVTMYNEDEVELLGSLTHIAQNVQYMQEKGEHEWTDVCVAVVSDGRYKANKGTLEWLTSVGLFDSAVMLDKEHLGETNVHLFERTVQLRDPKSGGFLPPLQVQFALKQNNAQKLDSHEWFFYGFARKMLPDYAVLVDCGTMCQKSAIARLINSMDNDSNLGGCCGEIAVDPGQLKICQYLNPVKSHMYVDLMTVGAQHFEYKMSNIMDKSLESCFGFISVLPGAFSAYRIRAIDMDPAAMANGVETTWPLAAYFDKSEKGLIKGNMYLAEDRILCFELIARRGCHWQMKYCKDAVAYTDVPGTVVDLLKQRRRWLNGSFFASIFAFNSFMRFIRDSGHTCFQKLCITIEFWYNTFILFLSFLLPANFYITIYFTLKLTFPGTVVDYFVHGLYIFLVLLQFMFALGNKMGPYKKKSTERALRGFYGVSTMLFGLIQMFCTTLFVYNIILLSGIKAFGDNATYINFSSSKHFPGATFTCSFEKFNNAFMSSLVKGKPGVSPYNTAARFSSVTPCQGSLFSQSQKYQTRYCPENKVQTGDFSNPTGEVGSLGGSCASLSDPIAYAAFNDACSFVSSPVVLEGVNNGGGNVPKVAKINTCMQSRNIAILMAILAIFVYFIAGALHLEMHHIILYVLHYWFLLPSTVNIFMVYSFCNLHDLSWGTKGLESGGGHGGGKDKAIRESTMRKSQGPTSQEEALQRQEEQFKAEKEEAAKAASDATKGDNEFRFFRSMVLCIFVTMNGLWIYAVLATLSGGCYLVYLAWVVSAINGIKLFFSFVYAVDYYFLGCCKSKKSRDNRDRRGLTQMDPTGAIQGNGMTPAAST